MAGSTNEIERSLRSLNRMIPKRPFDHIDEERITKIQVRLREIESGEPDTLQPTPAVRQVWSDSPRVYILLRCLQCSHEDAVAIIRKTKINDYSIPVGSLVRKQLPVACDEDEFEEVQFAFLSHDSQMKAETLTGLQPEHRRLEHAKLFFEDVEELGHGSSARVQRVRHRVSKLEFACKRIERGTARVQAENLEAFLRELRALQRLDHQHIVRLIASYSDEMTHSLILLPVARETLESLLHRLSSHLPDEYYEGTGMPSKTLDIEFQIVRGAFGCLLTTLVYLQNHALRHKDIKPLNILISNEGRVYLCDFGISLDYSSTETATTEGMTGFTPGYCAPEVGNGEPRNILSDVWSLGRVFFDMIVVLKRRSIHDAKKYIGLDPEKMSGLIQKYLASLLTEPGDQCDSRLIEHTLGMTAYDKADRPRADALLQAAPFKNGYQASGHLYIGDCCNHLVQKNFPKQTGPVPIHEVDLISGPVRADTPSMAESDQHNALRNSDSSTDPMTISELYGDEPSHRRSSHVGPTEMPGQGYHGNDMPITDVPRGMSIVQLPGNRDDCESTFSRSARSYQQRSSGSIILQSSISSSPPDGPSFVSASPLRGCLCMGRPTETGSTGSCILNIPLVSITSEETQDTAEIDPQCTLPDNSIRLFESYLQGNNATSGIWTKTRRLVISNKPNHTDMRSCRSFWLPLADIQYICYGTQVNLRWSDCNQLRETRLGDSNLTYSRIYKPATPNNQLRITFKDEVAVQKMIYAVTHADINPAILWQRVGTPSTQELRAFKVQQAPSHYVVHISTPKEHEVVSKMFIQQNNPVFDIWTHPIAGTVERGLSLRFCGGVSTPNYQSNIIDKPSDDKMVVAHCSRASLVFDAYSLSYSLTPSINDVGLPSELQSILAFLTGWTIRFYAYGIRIAEPGVFGKDYGESDVVLWENSQDTRISGPRNSVLGFRHSGPKKDYLWRTSIITPKSWASYKSPEAKVTTFRMSSGDLLDAQDLTTTVQAALPQHQLTHNAQHARKRAAGKHRKSHEDDTLKLVFGGYDDYNRFRNCFDELVQAAKTAARERIQLSPPSRWTQGSQSSGSRAGSFQHGW